MQILLACAKTMTGSPPGGLTAATEPAFGRETARMAVQLAGYSADELQHILHTNRKIAGENWLRYQNFFDGSTRVPAVFAYDGMVFKKLAPETWDGACLDYANRHLLICSFLYGLLRPLDLVNRYRMEGGVELPCNGYMTTFDHWKPILTGWLTEQVKADDGVMVNLASGEFRNMFYWKKVESAVNVITPEFKVEKGGRLKTVVIYTKMCRGAMSRWILENRITGVEDLKKFEYEGFRHLKDWTFVAG